MQRPRPVEGARQQGEVRLGESVSPFEEAHRDEEIEKDTATLTRHYTITVCNIVAGKDADRKGDGPRCATGAFLAARVKRFVSPRRA